MSLWNKRLNFDLNHPYSKTSSRGCIGPKPAECEGSERKTWVNYIERNFGKLDLNMGGGKIGTGNESKIERTLQVMV